MNVDFDKVTSPAAPKAEVGGGSLAKKIKPKYFIIGGLILGAAILAKNYLSGGTSTTSSGMDSGIYSAGGGESGGESGGSISTDDSDTNDAIGESLDNIESSLENISTMLADQTNDTNGTSPVDEVLQAAPYVPQTSIVTANDTGSIILASNDNTPTNSSDDKNRLTTKTTPATTGFGGFGTGITNTNPNTNTGLFTGGGGTAGGFAGRGASPEEKPVIRETVTPGKGRTPTTKPPTTTSSAKPLVTKRTPTGGGSVRK